MEHPILTIKNLQKSFGGAKILRNINFELTKNERVVVLGTSGSGKSTLLRCINRLEEPTAGKIYFNYQLVTDKNIRTIRRSIGMVFQHFNLINNLTVMQNLTLAPISLKLMDKKEAEKRALKLLRHIGLTEKADSYPASLSGGQKQRVAIIRAMMLSPDILLFDEPTSALDPEAIGDVLSLIRDLAKRGISMIIVTHEMGFAREIASRIIFLDKGKIIEEGKPNDFFTHPKTPRVREFLGKII